MTYCRNAAPGSVSPVPEERVHRLLAEVREQLEIALAPGGDPTPAARRLADCAEDWQPDIVRESARAALRIVVREVPPPRRAEPVTVSALWGIEDAGSFDPGARWARGAPVPVVPIGVAGDGSPVMLDLRDRAEGGAGPHALLVGATGSGKSELLRTLVLGLAVHNPPAGLALLLVDYRGGAAFAEFAGLPHVAGLALNLWEPGDVPNLATVLQAELLRRQDRWRETGSVPLPRLVVVIEEFPELLADTPALMDTLLPAARVGRSLGVHLVLAGQRLEEGRLRGLEAHLQCRVAMRTFSPHESWVALGAPDAYELPSAPGHALLRAGVDANANAGAGAGALVRFRAAYAGAEYRSATPTWAELLRTRPPSHLNVLLARLVAHGGGTRQLWPPGAVRPQ
jgi:S-DNA-T family DNA segregation ATPase FtsK/SpoIIIE